MSEETREQEYLRLFEEERVAFEAASRHADEGGKARREALAREWFAALARLLKAYWRSHALPGEGGPLAPVPTLAIDRIANLAEALSAGQLPQPVKDVNAAGGSPNRWPAARRDIATALFYIGHVKSGALKDKSHNMTVADAFGVQPTTVRDWLKNREEITAGIQEIPAERFPDALRRAGARYHWNRAKEQPEG